MSGRELEKLHHRIRRCTRCRLHENRTHAVPGEGDPSADLMLVGEAPGEQEDKEGRPFCGRSGRFFDDLLEGVGLRRQELFVTSSVKCRPPNNRNPRADELATCRHAWLEEQFRLIDPGVVVLMGKVASRQALDERGALRDVHGTIREENDRRFLLTYHPTAGMRFPEAKAAIKEDFRKLVTLADNGPNGG